MRERESLTTYMSYMALTCELLEHSVRTRHVRPVQHEPSSWPSNCQAECRHSTDSPHTGHSSNPATPTPHARFFCQNRSCFVSPKTSGKKFSHKCKLLPTDRVSFLEKRKKRHKEENIHKPMPYQCLPLWWQEVYESKDNSVLVHRTQLREHWFMNLFP